MKFKDTDGTDLLPYIIGSFTVGIGLIGIALVSIFKD